MTRISLDTIESLRLPDLRALFTEVTGETTKSPNKKFLIRRIRETLADQAAEIVEEDKAIEELAAARFEEPAAETVIAEVTVAAIEEPAEIGRASCRERVCLGV